MNKQNNSLSPDEYIYNYIREIISVVSPGGKLPGIRQLMQETSFGRLRLEKQLKKFELAGIIELKPQSGRYRSRRELISTPWVFIHFSHQPIVEKENSFAGGTVKYLRKKLAEQDQKLEIIHAALLSNNDLCSILKKQNVRQAFIWGAGNSELIKAVKAAVPHIVSLLPRYPESLSSELRDSPEMSAVQLDYLFKHNYRKIAYVHNAEKDWSQSPVQIMRLMDYYRIMAENGIKTEPEWVFYCAYNRKDFNESMHKLMRSNRPAEAIIVPGSALKLLYDFCADIGIKIGKDLAVICSDDTEPDLTPRATTVTNSPQEIGFAAWDVMQQTLQGNICSTTTALKIITGETLPRLPQADMQ